MADETPKMLIADDKSQMRSLLETAFSDRGFDIQCAADGGEAVNLINNNIFDIIITDYDMPEKDGLEVLRAAKQVSTDTQVLLITAYGTIDVAVEAMRLGAFDFVAKPFQLTELERKVDKILGRGKLNQKGGGNAGEAGVLESASRPIVGESASTKSLLKMIKKVAPSKSSVLITGESGTGKELIARALHESSPRNDQPFVALNCAALASGILESELFGHEKGAFTGSIDRRIGRFEKANGGTLFLDEVGDIDASIQTKLLRVLQEAEFERVGGIDTIKVDVRIIAATNRELRQAIKDGDFREDFYYRLNVFSLHAEPLRNRRDDIPALVEHFLAKYSRETGQPQSEVSDDVIGFFMRYAWPGNVRELENVLERAAVLAGGNTISTEELPQELLFSGDDTEVKTETAPQNASLIERKDDLEIELIKGALEKFRWNKTKAAEHLGLKRTTLQYKIRKYGLE